MRQKQTHQSQQGFQNDSQQCLEENLQVRERAQSLWSGFTTATQREVQEVTQNNSTSHENVYLPTEASVGSSTGAAFLQQIEDALEGGHSLQQPQAISRTTSTTTLPRIRHSPSGDATYPEVDFVLPTKRTADELFETFWQFVDPIFPWLDKPAMSQAYETLWANDKQMQIDARMFHCILNLIFALACELGSFQGPGSKPSAKSAGIFYSRAEQLMLCNLMELNSFENIQVLLLSALWQQNNCTPQRCLQSISLAIHIAQSIGLHLPAMIDGLTDLRDRQLARRVWHGCVILDKQAAMIFGSALKIPQTLAMVADYPATSPAQASVPANPQISSFYSAYCQLHHILGHVLELFYLTKCKASLGSSENAKRNNGIYMLIKLVPEVVRIESDLLSWRQHLPRQLLPESRPRGISQENIISRQANALQARHLCVRLLLLRPFLDPARSEIVAQNPAMIRNADCSITASIEKQCQLNCVDTARDLIGYLRREPERPLQLRSSGHGSQPFRRYIILYTYIAATVIIAAHLFPVLSEHVSSAELDNLIESACSILEVYDSSTKIARLYIVTLQRANEKVKRRRMCEVPTRTDSTSVAAAPPVVDAQDIEQPQQVEDEVSSALDFDFLDALSPDNSSSAWNNWFFSNVALDSNISL
ncbi:hypothetical protein G3M48_005541 [Beauveria asiatica]|uniref:Xylanolytic transcriptional activator regulatory domain-containing protein n=1 Tax=Beauveria asiatica TaxID=1069075 RepID=A0AAW0S683_9HYPO